MATVTVMSGMSYSISAGQTDNGDIVQSGGTLSIDSGGTAIGTSVLGSDTVLLGGTDDGAMIGSGGAQTVLGIASATIVSSGGSEIVGSGGTALATTVAISGFQQLSGGVASGTLVSGAVAVEQVFLGGLSISTTIVSGGVEQVLLAGVASNTIVSNGGMLSLAQGVSAFSTMVGSGGTENVVGGVSFNPIVSGGQEILAGGGATVSATISSVSSSGTVVFQGTETIGAGATATGTILTGNGLQVISAGGVASGTTIQQMGGGGSEIVLGTAIGTTVAFGSQTVSSGGTASGTLLEGGLLVVSSGGTAIGTKVTGGSETVLGTDIGAQLIGGLMTVSSGGVVSNATDGTTLTVSTGGLAVSTTLVSGSAEFIFGTASGTTASSGSFFVSSGGTGVGTVLTGKSLEVVFAGGVASGTTMGQAGNAGTSDIVLGTAIGALVDAGSQTVSSGGVASGTTLLGGMFIVGSGGTASGAKVIGGLESVRGTDVGALVSGGGFFTVSSGGVASNTTDAMQVTVSSGGLTVSSTLVSGGIEFVFGTASATTVSSGSLFVSSGGTGIGTILTGKSLEVVFAGGVASGTTMNQPGNSGTSDIVLGTALGTIIGAGSQTVSSGGTASGTTVLGGLLVVSSGGTAIGTKVSGGSETVFGTDIGAQLIGGLMTVSSGGVVSNATDGTTLTVSTGGLAVSTTVVSGSAEFIFGTASGTTVSSGSFFVSSGGTGIGTVLTGKSLEVVFAGGVASGTTMNQPSNAGTSDIVLGTAIGSLVDAGSQTVSSGGVASGTTLRGGMFIIGSGGTASGAKLTGGLESVRGTDVGALVSGGGFFIVSSGGVASNTTDAMQVTVSSGGLTVSSTLVSGGIEFVFGTASATTVSSGSLFVSSGGTGIGTILTGKSLEVVFAGGVASGTVMGQAGNLGTSEIVLGTAVGTMIDTGSQTVSSGGVASGTTLIVGGIQVVTAGGTAVGSVIEGPGSVDLQAGAATSGGITFSGPGGRLEIDGAAIPQGLVIFGFVPGDTLALPNIVFDSTGSAVLASGNVLNVTEDGNTLGIQLDPNQVFPVGAQFALQNDGNNGTLVTESPPCYCRGTLIATERGEVAVEHLAVGDRVRTLSGAFKRIVWIGMGRELVTRANKLARPVIVRQGALTDNVPYRDLYLTHGHALYVEGVLIPVENLINHHSILWDDTAQVVEYYHIELPDHDVVFAEGAPAETYYDASNRAFFQSTREGSEAAGEKPTFAPVVHDGEIVGKVWAELFERAGGRAAVESTDDPDLHLMLDGVRLDAVSAENGVYTFAVDRPSGGTLLLRSRAGVPSLLGVSRHEHRRLGVAIRQIIVHRPGVLTSFDPDAPLFRDGGCHAPENGHCWTDGELALRAECFAHLRGDFTLIVQTRPQSLRYPLERELAAVA